MARRTIVDPRFGARLRELMNDRGLSLRALEARVHYSRSRLHAVTSGKAPPTADIARRLDEALGVNEFTAMVTVETVNGGDDEVEALELARQVAASDVGEETLARLEQTVDELAMAYAAVPPDELLERVRHYLGYVGRIVDARMTLRQQRRLLVVGGWLSLLAATTHIDLRQSAAAHARLTTAAQLAGHAEHPELEAWCLETRAWDALTDGDFPRAVDLSRHAQAVAPEGSSAHIQATAQEGRAWARMRQRTPTRGALDRVDQLTSSLAVPDRPEHHYRYDPDKALSYTATTLAWAGDPAAEEYTRTLIRQLEGSGNALPRPRRVTLARLDLALALLAVDRADEAAAEATTAIASGRLVPSNWWRATEVLSVVERLEVAEAVELREVYQANLPAVQPGVRAPRPRG